MENPFSLFGRFLTAAPLQRRFVGATVVLVILAVTGQANAVPQKAADIMSLEIEQLMDIQITSVSKKEQRLSDAAAAIFVITQEDIRRSGVTSIPEALRMVPGMQVARFNTNRWAISARGFNTPYGDKLLVLIDGRTVYSPLFSGVFWDVQDTLMEDIERIEVIRGPGASLWGSNAVNGVINIITKHSENTQGGLVTAGGGTEERGFGSVRYGGALGDATTYRAYAKYFDRNPAVDSEGKRANDGWKAGRGGFRLDHAASAENAFTLQGDIYRSRADQTVNMFLPGPPFTAALDDTAVSTGGNLLGRWSRETADSGTSLQLYFDHAVRDEFELKERISTYDVDFQHRLALPWSNEVTLGAGYRHTRDRLGSSPLNVVVSRSEKSNNLFSGFIQDQITLVPDTLRLILGTKLEHNDYSGFEVQPNARMIWTPDPRNSLWAAVSRAVRTPYRFSSDADMGLFSAPAPDGAPADVQSTFGVVHGNGDTYKSEELLAYELGYRLKAAESLSIDVSTFYNVYRHLTTYEPEEPYFTPTQFLVPYTWGNKLHGDVYGVEVAAQWKVQKWWRLQAAYSYLHMHLVHDSDSGDTAYLNVGGENHRHRVSLRSSFDLLKDLELDLWLRYEDNLPQLSIPSYTGLDARLAWKASRTVEIALIGQNLLRSHHAEFNHFDTNAHPTEEQRGVFGKVTWQF